MNLWQQALQKIESKVQRKTFETWFKPTQFLSSSRDTLTVQVPHILFTEWITSQFLPIIHETLAEIGHPALTVRFVSRQELTASAVAAMGSAPSPAPSARLQGAARAADPAPGDLNPSYTFDSFVVGSCNQFAHAASVAVAEVPGRAYNPLYLYGGVGLGKTHLMHSIGNHIRKASPGARLAYLSAERFMNEMITSIRLKRTPDFRQKYRTIDVLLIDDIQFLEGKEGTQEEFFHTFNTLYENQKQIVISSDCPPKEISTLEERLRSRFEWGLIADHHPPDTETLVAILRKKAESSGNAVPDDVALFIASNVRSNIRELEGCLTRVHANARLLGRPVDLALARESLRGLLQGSQVRVLTIEEIQKSVAQHFKVKVADLKARNNSKQVSEPRQVAMYLCKRLLPASFPEIGRRFGGKHHSTVIYSVRVVEERMEADPRFRATVNSLFEGLR